MRSHIMSAVGMAPREYHAQQAVLVWEGVVGAFYLVDLAKAQGLDDMVVDDIWFRRRGA